MNKPIVGAIVMFTAISVAPLARSYFFTQETVDWWIELSSALFVALMWYAFAQRQQKMTSQTDSGQE
jgi:hypothetical protein